MRKLERIVRVGWDQYFLGDTMGRKKNGLQQTTYLEGCEIKESELRNLVQHLEEKIEDRKIINEQITSIMKDAESLGFHPKVLREVIRLRTMDSNKRLTLDNLLPFYLKAVEEPCGNLSIGLLYYSEDVGTEKSHGKVPANS